MPTKVAPQPSQNGFSGSNIPVASPRSVRSTLPSPLPSGNAPIRSGTVSASTSITTTENASGSGIPAFRALRSLLPFGPGRLPTPIANNASSNVAKSSFMTFGSVRRSMTGERKNSLSYSRPEEIVESPVISIHSSSDDTEKMNSFQKGESHVVCDPIRLPVSPSTQSTASSLSQGSPLPTELSTIIEADTSGISTHVPPLSESHPEGCPDSPHPDPLFSNLPESGLPEISFSLDAENLRDGNEQTLDGLDDSALDLPTSRLELEVRDAMAAERQKSAAWWLQDTNMPVLDVTEQSPKDQDAENDPGVAGGNPNASFNLDALDPDLAVLLSSNRNRSKNTAVTNLIAPKPLGSTLKERAVPSGSQKLSRIPSPHSSDLIPPQSSPVRRTFLNSSSRIPSSSSLPRLRPTTSQPTPLRPNKELPLLPSVSIYPEVQTSDDTKLHDSVESLRQRRSPPPPPSSSVSFEGQNVTWNPTHRRVPQSRLMTPSRHASYSSAGIQRPRLRPSPPKTDGASASSSSPGYSSLGNAASTRLLGNIRTSLDSDSRTETAERNRPRILRNRKRSMSLETHRTSPGSTVSYHTRPSYLRPSSSLSYARPTPEWLGPRTARAFAAAGLLNMDRDPPLSSGRGISRAGHTRGGGEQDPRTQHTPSRMAFSDASGSNSSWGRSGSISNTVTTSEAGGRLMESPTFSSITPRTNFSGGSTAATSISAVSSTQYQLQNTIQSMKDRHEVETEALLAALSDSQHTTKVLRGEIFELRERMQYMEDQLAEARRLLQRYQSSPSTPLSHSTPGLSADSRTRTGSTDDLHRQVQSPLPPDTPHISFVKGQAYRDSTMVPPSTFELPSKAQLKRFSATSSVFPVPPSNMTMLMTEEGVAPDRSGVISSRSISPPSSTVPLSVRMRHAHSRSMSSGGNISPTTANFSMTEMTGSPGSLCLRPEHEMHLGDMVSLDLGYSRGEEVGGNDEY